MNCGAKLPDTAKFCYSCGTPVDNSGTKKMVSEETVRVQPVKMSMCPNCGFSISPMSAVCPFCGSQIANRKAAMSAKEFTEKLYEIERNSGGTGKELLVRELGVISKSFKQKILLISTFPIPNTVEEITEFVIIAANSIDVKWGKDTSKNRLWSKNPVFRHYTDITLANTWINKLHQAYDKAKISFPNDPMFKKIEEIYNNKMKELDRLN